MKRLFLFSWREPFLLAVLASMVVMVSGCKTCKPGQEGKKKPYNIQVNLDPSLKGKCDVVDLVGVNPASYSRWQEYSMSNYWREGDPLRRDSTPDRVTL